MSLSNVVGLVREESREAIVQALKNANIRGVTVSPTKGYGEYQNNFANDTANTCLRFDVMIESERAEEVAAIIMNAAHTGLDGDGEA